MREREYIDRIRQIISDKYVSACRDKSNYVKRLEELNRTLKKDVYGLSYGEYVRITYEISKLEKELTLLSRDINIWGQAREIYLDAIDDLIEDNKHIRLEVKLPKCPYWNYETHVSTHDCHDCNCASEGNTIKNSEFGVMADNDRYCMLECNIRAEIVKKLEDTNEFN